MNSDESQNIKCHSLSILSFEFCRGGSKLQFGANLQGVKMTLERWQHYYITFTQRLVGLLVKSVAFSSFVAFYVSGGSSKMEK